MNEKQQPAIWFPAVRTGTGTDVFTETLVAELQKRGLRAQITWLPLRAEYAPWTVAIPKPPEWANVAHVNTWLNPRFMPKRLPIVATIHHSVHHPDLRPYKGLARAAYHRWWIAPNERRVLHRTHQIIAVSQFVAETARKTLLNVPMKVIYNGVDTNRYRPGNRQRAADDPFRLLYLGSWIARKGVDLLAPIMRELGDGFELRYTGGSEAAKDRAAMPSNMHDLGHLQGADAVLNAMQNADALLFPSRNEGFGLVVIEAMANGLAVIATNGSALIETVKNGETGMLCRQDDVQQFVHACRTLAENRNLHGSMSKAARACAFANFSIDRMVDMYRAIYEKCIDM